MKILPFLLLLVLAELHILHAREFGKFAKMKMSRVKKMRNAFQRSAVLSAGLGFKKFKEGKRPKISFANRSKCRWISNKFRTADGSCNNRRRPWWGQANKKYLRMTDVTYGDGQVLPTQQGLNGNLPSPRLICIKVAGAKSKPAQQYSYMVMQWGQFVDHDLQATPTYTSSTDCCENVTSNYSYSSGPCFPIVIPDNDPFYNHTCMKFVRSRAFDEEAEVREQFNTLTAFVDGSAVYGSSEDEMDILRTGNDGMLLTKGKDFLPEDQESVCKKKHPGDYCFLAGDARVNVFPGLAAMHTLFVRFHNKIARMISMTAKIGMLLRTKKLHDYNDEMIFQTTRKIVSAVMQKINYEEYLPLVLGPESEIMHEINEPYRYQHGLNPGIINAFAASAFRFGHSQIPNTLRIDNEDVPINKLYFDTNVVLNRFSDIIYSTVRNCSDDSDMLFSPGMSNKLFPSNNKSLDILSLNLQRGRDHGLGSYNSYRQACGLHVATSLSDEAIFGECASKLGSVYSSVDDVDLYVGAMCEPHINDGMVGPTFSCIIGRQFYNLKFGDRFWYQAKSPMGLSKPLQAFVRDISMASILCDHGDIEEVQPYAFLAPSDERNKVVPCSKIPKYSIIHLVHHMLSN